MHTKTCLQWERPHNAYFNLIIFKTFNMRHTHDSLWQSLAKISRPSLQYSLAKETCNSCFHILHKRSLEGVLYLNQSSLITLSVSFTTLTFGPSWYFPMHLQVNQIFSCLSLPSESHPTTQIILLLAISSHTNSYPL